MNQNQLVIKGTILGLTYEQWVNDMTMFVSTSLMIVENWADITFDFAQEFRLEHSEHVRKRYGETRQAAFRYGLNLQEADQNVVDLCCTKYLEDDKQWDFALLTINTSLLEVKNNPFPGVYECLYRPILLEFVPFGFYRVFLIDAATALKHADSAAYKTALEYSKYDNEWLVLPAMSKDFQGKIEYLAILDAGCFSRNYYYEIDREQRELYNIISYS